MAASSSRAVAATAVSFPTALEREAVDLVRKSQSYAGTVLAVHHGVRVDTVVLKIAVRIPKRGFCPGEPVWLQATDGRRWAGEIGVPGGERESLYSWVHVEVRHETGEFAGFENESFVNMYPFHKPQLKLSLAPRNNWFEVDFSMDESNQLTDTKAKAEPKEFKLQVGLIGFGAIGRQVADTLVDIEDLNLVAIVDNVTVYDMIMAWKSSKFSLRISGEKALLFKRKTPEPDKKDDIMVTVFNTREHEKNPWGQLSVSYVIDTVNVFSEENKRIVYSAHAWNNLLPEEELLPQENHAVYRMVHGDKGVFDCFSLPIKYMKVMISAEKVNKSLLESFPEWRDGHVNICFCAEADPTNRLCDPLMELNCKAEEEEHIQKQAGDRWISLLRCCVRVLRRAAIGGVFLMM